MSTPGQGSILGSPIIYGKVDYGPTHGQVYRPLNQKRVVTAAGNDTVQPFDQTVIYKKTVPAAFQVILPDVSVWMIAPYGGFDLIFIDGVGNAATYPITFVPFDSQTIDGVHANTVMSTNNGTVIFVPLVDKTGWTLIEAWPSSGSSSADPPDTSVQFNDGGAFGGQANFTFIKGTGLVSLPSLEVQTGNVNSPAGAGTTDSGTALSLTAGTGGATSGAGGAVGMQGGSASGGGAGGEVNLHSGDASATGAGGNLVAVAGDADTIGRGGNVTCAAGTGGGTSGDGGNLAFTSGDALGIGDSGFIHLISGTAHGTGAGGAVVIDAGDASNGNGGTVTIDGGAGGTNGNGGNITLVPGLKAGAGVDGHVKIDTLGNFADDAAAAVGGVPVLGLYRTASAVKVRVT